MSTRSGLVGEKKHPGPIWGHLRPFFHGPKKSQNSNILPIFLGGPMGPNRSERAILTNTRRKPLVSSPQRSTWAHVKSTRSLMRQDSFTVSKRVEKQKTEGLQSKISALFAFVRSMEKMASDGPRYGQDDFFLLIQTLPTFRAERI